MLRSLPSKLFSKILDFLGSKQFGDILEFIIKACRYILSFSFAVLGLIALFFGEPLLGIRTIVVAILFCPLVKISNFWQFFFGGIIVAFML
ncbi:hypothetical protein Cri9333_0619 [Crinalium epipsammum PCC 9333]|uniref:Uncharacterized protein n=1 Tax=Crinalium epipsammum PCC 9333 TaxID=1173022 RepID=K9VVR0_9CYAN|nr:hypothetical protein [Crinalium epipsammum]AFZ11562.1 hypothetical protein Cri9333_0619 [Crinalium epipsammum PCC 9333]